MNRLGILIKIIPKKKNSNKNIGEGVSSPNIFILRRIYNGKGRKPKAKLAMTGEITLNGSVLAIGGVREKLLAAARKNMTDVIVPASNRKDVEEYERQGVKFGLNIHYVKNINEVLKTALDKE